MDYKLLNKDDIPKVKPLIEALGAYHNKIPQKTPVKYPLVPVSEGIAFMISCQENNTGKVMGLYDDDRIVGFAAIHFENGKGLLDYLFVYDEYRRNGYGGKLMNWALDEFKAADAEYAELKVVYGNNTKGLYEKFGFNTRCEIMALKLK
ncbi:MAG: GNAT family N-acetyltransferase [Firmicutes bacterium]|nr:GNAT family N-acetyltransferase [Bacillota bacterium]